MHFNAAFGLRDSEGFDSYDSVVIEASSEQEAKFLANQVLADLVGEFWVSGVLLSVEQIELCLREKCIPGVQEFSSQKCENNNLLVPTGRVPWGVEELTPLLCEGRWEWRNRWVESPLVQSNCP